MCKMQNANVVNFEQITLTKLFVSIEQVLQFDVQFLDTDQLNVDFLDLDISLIVLLIRSAGHFFQLQNGIVYRMHKTFKP